ncbi:hypothetical protein C2I06_22530 [Niallia circulans]|nr:hypothetical protein C2I06_22530 [Niallia circulans]
MDLKSGTIGNFEDYSNLVIYRNSTDVWRCGCFHIRMIFQKVGLLGLNAFVIQQKFQGGAMQRSV